MTPAERVKQRAGELGFELAGIAGAEPFPEDEARILDWLGRGLNAGLAWMTEPRTRQSCRPDELLQGAQSLIVVGASYVTPAPSQHGAPPFGPPRVTPRPPRPQAGEGAKGRRPQGRVARYARGRDYHDVMRASLKELAALIAEIGGEGTRSRIFVDSSPLPERAAAVRAGLGFVGKNTNLLTAKAGSWLLLGAVLTTLWLERDRPVERDCGRCRLCLDACPTGALPEPYLLDANRCISYLTIEHRGPLPPELRPAIGDHVFGCDICQDVCPWNRAQRPPGWPALLGDSEAANPSLAGLLALDDAAFREHYRDTPVWRTKRRGLLRNAAVALGNVGSAEDLPALERALADPEPLVRGHAAWAIGRIGDPRGRAILEDASSRESDPGVRAEIDAALTVLPASPPRQAGEGTGA